MKNYSLKKSLEYMVMAFYRPKRVIDFFLQKPSFLYSVFPLIVFITLFEIWAVLDYISGAPAFLNLFTQIFGIPEVEYNFYKIFLLPIVHIVDFVIFGGVIYSVSRILRIHKLDTTKTIFFFMFVWNTIGLIGFITEYLSIRGKMDLLLYVQPIYAVINLVYPVEFVHKQADVSRRKSLVPILSGLIVFLGFRMIFLV